MQMTSIWHWLILLVAVLLLFGAGKIPRLMGDMASIIKAFKKSMKDDEASAEPATTKTGHAPPPASAPAPKNPTGQIVAPVTPQIRRGGTGRWKFVGAAVGGLLGAVILGGLSLPLFGVLAVPGLIFGIHYGGLVGRGFDYIEPKS